jgi:transposase
VSADTLPLRREATPADLSTRGLTVRDVAKRYRVSPDKVRGWIRRGELKAVNTATTLCGRPRWVVSADALTEFEKCRAAAPAPKPTTRRRRQVQVDYYP